MPQQTWDKVLTVEVWDEFPTCKIRFLSGDYQKIAAGIFGNTLLLVVGERPTAHKALLQIARGKLVEKGFDLPEVPSWTGGGFIAYLNKAQCLDIMGDSETLGGSLTPEVRALALGKFFELEWLPHNQ